MRSLDFSIDLILPAALCMALGYTQPLTEMSTSNLPGDKGRPARKADNLTAVPWLRQFVAGFRPRLPGFEPRSGHVGFVVDKAALG
jgi:hypothetical protein